MKPIPDLVGLELEAQEAAADLAAPVAAPAPGGPRRLLLLCIGHFTIDLYSGALGALQPLLVVRYSLSLLQAGILGGLLSFSSAVMQPFYGYLSDRLQVRAFTVLAPLVAGVFISCLGLAPGYKTLIALVLLGGVGIAAFHPQGTAHAASTLRARRGLAMAIFITSGTVGLSAGPVYFSLLVGRIGFEKSYWAMLPALALTLVFAFTLPGPPPHPHAAGPRFDLAPFRRVWKSILVLYVLVVIRSIIQIVCAQFLPLYFHLERGFSVVAASYTLTLFLLGGALGGFLGGNLADRFGGKRVVMFSMIASVPFLWLFMATRGWLSIVGLFLGGLIVLFTIPVNVTMAQDLVPTQAGTVSALMMGFAWGMAGLVMIPCFGWAADHVGLNAAFWTLVFLPLVGFVLSVLLPDDTPGATRRPLASAPAVAE